MIEKIILFSVFLVIAFYLGCFLGRIIFGKPKIFNKLASKYKQSNQIMRHIKNSHYLTGKCSKIECLVSWKEVEKEISILEKKQSKFVKFIISLFYKKK